MEKKFSLNQIAMIGLMAAAVYVSSAFLQIPIPTPIDNTRLHMGNVMCLLSGILLGPVPGGLAAGIGSAFFDLTNPLYIASTPFTFVFKFIMAWLCGKVAQGNSFTYTKQLVLSATLGSLAYIVLYLTKSFIEQRYFLNIPLDVVMATTLQKAIVSTVNAVISVIIVVPLSKALKPSVDKMLNT